MEDKIISAFMHIKGYDQYICDIFPDWEYVKDEILLPERKSGSGNGTVHVYLLQNNLDKLTQCFPNYLKNKIIGQNFSDDDCPIVEHFCLVSNLITVAGLTYHHLNCDDSKFNLLDYLKNMLALESEGMIQFESIFKLSTDRRPYFKQFTKKIFSQLIRPLFLHDLTAYKISLYKSSETSNIAAFWQIGECSHSFTILPSKNVKEEQQQTTESDDSSKENTISNTLIESQFRDFLTKKNLRQRSIDNYVNVLNQILPRLMRDSMGMNIHSVFEIKNLNELLMLDNQFRTVPAIQEYNKIGRNQLSAAFHNYIKFRESLLSDQELADCLFQHK